MSVDWDKELAGLDLGSESAQPKEQLVRAITPVEQAMLTSIEKGLAASAGGFIGIFWRVDEESGQRMMAMRIVGTTDDDLVVGLLMRAVQFAQQQPRG